jgi:hypothetical protein
VWFVVQIMAARSSTISYPVHHVFAVTIECATSAKAVRLVADDEKLIELAWHSCIVGPIPGAGNFLVATDDAVHLMSVSSEVQRFDSQQAADGAVRLCAWLSERQATWGGNASGVFSKTYTSAEDAAMHIESARVSYEAHATRMKKAIHEAVCTKREEATKKKQSTRRLRKITEDD